MKGKKKRNFYRKITRMSHLMLYVQFSFIGTNLIELLFIDSCAKKLKSHCVCFENYYCCYANLQDVYGFHVNTDILIVLELLMVLI